MTPLCMQMPITTYITDVTAYENDIGYASGITDDIIAYATDVITYDNC